MRKVIFLVLACTLSARAAEPTPPSVEWSWHLRLHLLSDDDRVQLLRIVPGSRDALVCTAPCNAMLDYRASDVFVLDGPGLLASRPFQFRPRDGDVTMRVSAGPWIPRAVGSVTLVGGGLTALWGGLNLAGRLAFGDVFCDQDPKCIEGHAREKRTSTFITFTGLAVALVGGVLILSSHPTTYTVEQ
jgi:hypothetical protein